jgi:anti-sigma factor RsiW
MSMSERDEISALLVFLANGTLEGAEKSRVEAALGADPELQAEFSVLKQIRTQMQSDAVERSPGEFGHARLMRDLAREAPPGRSNRLWQGLAAAALALLVVQTVFSLNGGSLIRLAGGETETTSGPVLTVAFAGSATEADIRALLIEAELTIVSGPSALGLYRLAAKDEAARTAGLAKMNAAGNIVESAEVEE